MLRITEYIRETLQEKAERESKGIVCIWNLTNACNLYCKHCYSSANQQTDTELGIDEIKAVIPELQRAGVKFVILSGGEPLLRESAFEVAKLLRERGMMTYLSSNGLPINKGNIEDIKSSFDYVGISIDGEPETHDSFRGLKGAYERAMAAIRMCMGWGIGVGLRFTLSSLTLRSLPYVFELVEREGIPKLYISHLVYSGRGKDISDLDTGAYLKAAKFIMDKAFEYVEADKQIRIVTGNNDSEAVLLLREFEKRYPEFYDDIYRRLKMWGGNQAGVRLVNINFRGDVRPDPFFQHPIGNLRETGFNEIWNSNGILSSLREMPRILKGKCGACNFIEICNGNSRPRAYAVYGDYLMEDPVCIL